VPPLYPDLTVVREAFPSLKDVRRVPDTDHYSIVMSDAGARAVVNAARTPS
jgi:hypothetical protein